MATATARLEVLMSPDDRELIEQAAELEGEPVSAFTRDAVRARAERVIRGHQASTVLPAEFFDDLMEALDSPARANAALAEAASRHRRQIRHE